MELLLYWMCKEFGALPSQLYDEDAEMMGRMTMLGSIYRAVKEYRGAKGDAIHHLSESTGETVAWLVEIGVMD